MYVLCTSAAVADRGIEGPRRSIGQIRLRQGSRRNTTTTTPTPQHRRSNTSKSKNPRAREACRYFAHTRKNRHKFPHKAGRQAGKQPVYIQNRHRNRQCRRHCHAGLASPPGRRNQLSGVDVKRWGMGIGGESRAWEPGRGPAHAESCGNFALLHFLHACDNTAGGGRDDHPT